MSLRLTPAADHATSFTHLRSAGAPSAPGLHDVLRSGVGPNALDAALPLLSPSSNSNDNDNDNSNSNAAPAISKHPLEARLAGWEATREALRMETLRRTYGIAEPVRRAMELKLTRDSDWRPLALGGTGSGKGSVSEEILAGRDADILWEDVFAGEEARVAVSVHEEMERKLQI